MRVPQAQPRTSTPGGTIAAPSGAGASYETFGGGIGDALQGTAKGMATLGDYLNTQLDAHKRFTATKGLQDLQRGVEDDLLKMRQDTELSATDYVERADQLFEQRRRAYLQGVAPELQQEFDVRLGEIGNSLHGQNQTFQLGLTNQYFTDQMNDALNNSKLALESDPTVENLEVQRANLDLLLDQSTLSEAEKTAMRRQMYTQLETTAYSQGLTEYYTEQAKEGPFGSARTQAEDLLREFEGQGPGSDSLTFEENQQLLSERVVAAENVAVEQLGNLDTWANIPARVRAGLISLIAEEGELPENVLKAIRSGDLENVAAAVAALGGDRREMEASIIRGDIEMPENRLDSDPRFANVAYEDRLALRNDARTNAVAAMTAQTEAQKAENNSLVNALMVDLIDGNAGQMEIDDARERGILTDVDDIIKAQKMLADRVGDVQLAAQGWEMLGSGTTFNPGSTEHKDMLNAMVGKTGLQALDEMDAGYAANTLVPLVRQSQDVPTEVAGLLTGMIHSSNEEKALWALDLMAQLQEASPAGFALRTTDNPVARDVDFWRQHKDIWTGPQIVEALRGGSVEQRALKQQLREEAVARMNDADDPVPFSMDMVLREFTSGGFLGIGASTPQLPTVPWVAEAMESEFRTLVTEEYVKDGDMQKAQERALAELHRHWAVTDVGGAATLMKYPPQLAGYKPLSESYDWIEVQLREEMALPDDATFQLVSDAQTKAEISDFSAGVGGPPSYSVVWTDGEGNVHADIDWLTGEPVRRFFEPTEEMLLADEATFGQKQAQIELESFLNIYMQAQQHSLETGEPIPDEIQNKYDELVAANNGSVFGRPVM